MVKFGGSGKKKQACILRKCSELCQLPPQPQVTITNHNYALCTICDHITNSSQNNSDPRHHYVANNFFANNYTLN